MNKHNGEVVEKVIRRIGYSVSKLALQLNVNRRTVYNWFQSESVKKEVIFKIGKVVNYDFSSEFPELFTQTDFAGIQTGLDLSFMTSYDQQKVDVWKDKYLELLEEYNKLLSEDCAA